MGKLAGKLLAAFVVLVLLGLGLTWLMFDRIVKSTLEQSITNALGVSTNIDKLSLNLFDGKMQVEGLTVSNPQGFSSPYAMKIERFAIGLKPASLLSDTVEIQNFEVDGLNINLEQQLENSNIATIGTSLQQHKKTDPQSSDRPTGEKKVKAGHVAIRNATTTVQVFALGRVVHTATVRLPQIEMNNVSEKDAGTLLGELAVQVAKGTFDAAVDEKKNSLPAKLFQLLLPK